MQTAAKMALYTLYLPLTAHNGQAISPASLRWVMREIAGFSGGCTLLPPGEGLWIAEQQPYYDQVLPIQIVAAVSAETTTFFHRLAVELAALLAQREIFIHCSAVMTLAAQSAWPDLEINLG